MTEQILEKTRLQKIIELATSEHGETVIEVIKLVSKKMPIVGDSEYLTVVNAVTIETQQNIMVDILNMFEKIRKGDVTNIVQ